MPIVKPEELESWKGKEVGVSDWFEASQDRINKFADCTEDHQFIHVDEEAAAKTPFGGTIAHGLLTLSLMPAMSYGVTLGLEGTVMGINYGYDKVRFLNPVRAGSKVRARHVLVDAQEKQPGRWLLSYDVTVEIEGIETPALIARSLVMVVVG
ncbi:Acyl dehydratase [Parasphingorhabdus marina DSM 22363]|uniref:Acyl dehydratase n=1 Tax=Parasphingorhabdus marina DSM 22363 TaxID=1123272 RepID=A0A1N6CMV1_9SPHN|nr:MaoC family dehydratase [Parasphingorhabdus marina]SIN59900.1 Acyl dehydratase [Parasphingorhabdus marina DSM 22363]